MYFWQSFVYASFATITQYGNKVGGIVDLWFLNSDFIKQFLKAYSLPGTVLHIEWLSSSFSSFFPALKCETPEH